MYICGDRCLAVAVGRLEHDGVLCGRLSTDDVLFDAFFSVGVRICRELICARGVQEVCSIANVAITDMVAGGWGIVLSLRSGYDIHNVVRDCFVRLSLHLLGCSSWCSLNPLAGLLFVDWALLVRRSATDQPGECEERWGRSADKRHVSDVLLMGFENVFIDSGSDLEFHPEFFHIAGDGEGLACGNCGRQRHSVDFYVIFSFDRSALFKGLDVIEL